MHCQVKLIRITNLTISLVYYIDTRYSLLAKRYVVCEIFYLSSALLNSEYIGYNATARVCCRYTVHTVATPKRLHKHFIQHRRQISFYTFGERTNLFNRFTVISNGSRFHRIVFFPIKIYEIIRSVFSSSIAIMSINCS